MWEYNRTDSCGLKVRNRILPSQFEMKVKLNHEEAQMPTLGSDLAAGFDLYSCESILIPKKGRALVNTGISLEIHKNCYGRVAPRSSLALKFCIDVGAGVIDCDYRGDGGIILINDSNRDYEVYTGARIAQLIITPIFRPTLIQVEELDNTDRGEGGFGSTGI